MNSFPSTADRKIARKDPDWPGLGPLSIPVPITAARLYKIIREGSDLIDGEEKGAGVSRTILMGKGFAN